MKGYIVNYALHFETRKELTEYCETILRGLSEEELENTRFYLPHLGFQRNARHSAVRILRGMGYTVLVIK